MSIKVGFISLGCSKNQVDTEYMIGQIFEDENFEVVSSSNKADVVVINTCAFIDVAKKEAIDTILEYAEKKKHGLKSIIVTGCLAQRYKKEILKNIPEVDAVLGSFSQHLLKTAIKRSIEGEKFENFENKNCFEYNSSRVISTPSHYAYLKIAEGCNNFCSYCAIPHIKGRYKSRPVEDIIKEAKWLEEKNVKEIILIAQDTTYYGFDLYKKFKLSQLLNELSKLDFTWIRFLYAYPERIDISLVETIAKNKNIVPYFDIPIQHINDDILKNMNRKTTSKQIFEKINLIRNILPDVALRTTLIAGFPGETALQFEELLDFVKEIKFDRLGCFSYSQEEGTRAAFFKDQIDEKTKRFRTHTIYKISEKILEEKCKKLIYKCIDVMVDGKQKFGFVGRTKKDAPDVDCNVFFSSPANLNPGDIVKVKIENTNGHDLFGKAIEPF